jgi:hypothetical protein
MPLTRTPHGAIHDLFSTPVFTALPAACLVMARRFGRAHDWSWMVYSMITAAVFSVSFVLAAVGFSQAPGFAALGGWWQRVALVTGLAWMLLVARHAERAMTSANRSQTSATRST